MIYSKILSAAEEHALVAVNNVVSHRQAIVVALSSYNNFICVVGRRTAVQGESVDSHVVDVHPDVDENIGIGDGAGDLHNGFVAGPARGIHACLSTSQRDAIADIQPFIESPCIDVDCVASHRRIDAALDAAAALRHIDVIADVANQALSGLIKGVIDAVLKIEPLIRAHSGAGLTVELGASRINIHCRAVAQADVGLEVSGEVRVAYVQIRIGRVAVDPQADVAVLRNSAKRVAADADAARCHDEYAAANAVDRIAIKHATAVCHNAPVANAVAIDNVVRNTDSRVGVDGHLGIVDRVFGYRQRACAHGQNARGAPA